MPVGWDRPFHQPFQCFSSPFLSFNATKREEDEESLRWVGRLKTKENKRREKYEREEE